MQKLVIDADKKSLLPDLRELFAYKDLFYTLTYRDIKVRYAQTFLGFAWALIQPLITLALFIVIFNKAIQVDTGNVPYIAFALSGLCVWSYFSFVLSQSAQSVIAEQAMIKKIYFPRIIMPLSKAVTGLVDFCILLVFVIGALLYYGIAPGANIVFLPAFILLAIITALGAGTWISALTIRFRDFQHIVPFLLQIGLYASPIAYPSGFFPEKFHSIYYINPIAGIVEGFRWSLSLGPAPGDHIYISISIAVLLFITGVIYFRRTEKVMADIL